MKNLIWGKAPNNVFIDKSVFERNYLIKIDRFFIELNNSIFFFIL